MENKLLGGKRDFIASCETVRKILEICDSVIPGEVSGVYDKLMKELVRYDQSLSNLCHDEEEFGSFLATYDDLKNEKKKLVASEEELKKVSLQILEGRKSKDYLKLLNLLSADIEYADKVVFFRQTIERKIEELAMFDSQLGELMKERDYTNVGAIALLEIPDCEEEISSFFQKFKNSKYSSVITDALEKSYYDIGYLAIDAEVLNDNIKNREKKFEENYSKRNEEYVRRASELSCEVGSVNKCIWDIKKSVLDMEALGGVKRLDNLRMYSCHYKKIEEMAYLTDYEKEQIKGWLPNYLKFKKACYKEIGKLAKEVLDTYKNDEVVVAFTDVSRLKNSSVVYDDKLGINFRILESLATSSGLCSLDFGNFVRGESNLLFSLIFSKDKENDSNYLAMIRITDYLENGKVPEKSYSEFILNDALSDASENLDKVIIDKDRKRNLYHRNFYHR